jgi:hypothetical protein
MRPKGRIFFIQNIIILSFINIYGADDIYAYPLLFFDQGKRAFSKESDFLEKALKTDSILHFTTF